MYIKQPITKTFIQLHQGDKVKVTNRKDFGEVYLCEFNGVRFALHKDELSETPVMRLPELVTSKKSKR